MSTEVQPQGSHEVYEAEDGWRWRLKGLNGEIVAMGEAHTSRRDAQRALNRMLAISRTLPNNQEGDE